MIFKSRQDQDIFINIRSKKCQAKYSLAFLFAIGVFPQLNKKV
jgi:hypothetical protein